MSKVLTSPKATILVLVGIIIVLIWSLAYITSLAVKFKEQLKELKTKDKK